MNKNILIVTTFNDNYNFFSRLEPLFKKRGYNFVYITNKHSIVLNLKKNKEEFAIIKYSNGDYYEKYDFSKTTEIAGNSISAQSSAQLVNGVFKTLAQLNSTYNFEYIFMWNGYRLIETAANYFAKENSIKTCFFELGNFPGKVFCDPLGTNAASLLAKSKSVLGKFNTSIESYRSWAQKYREDSLRQHSVPQGKTAKSINYSKNLHDLSGFVFHNYAKFEPVVSIKKLQNKFFAKKADYHYDHINIHNSEYIFFPMQLSIDSQLLINSDVDNFQAIRIAAEEASDRNIELIVKPHPAEIDQKVYEELYELKEVFTFSITGDNTIELVDKAAKVITINSTVGLQAKILGKDVECLGKAFYSDFDENDLALYMNEYLLNIEFWDNSPIEDYIADKILQRADLTGTDDA